MLLQHPQVYKALQINCPNKQQELTMLTQCYAKPFHSVPDKGGDMSAGVRQT